MSEKSLIEQLQKYNIDIFSVKTYGVNDEYLKDLVINSNRIRYENEKNPKDMLTFREYMELRFCESRGFIYLPDIFKDVFSALRNIYYNIVIQLHGDIEFGLPVYEYVNGQYCISERNENYRSFVQFYEVTSSTEQASLNPTWQWSNELYISKAEADAVNYFIGDTSDDKTIEHIQKRCYQLYIENKLFSDSLECDLEVKIKEPSPKSKNSYLRTIEALVNSLIDGSTGRHNTDAEAVISKLAQSGIELPIGKETLANYLREAKTII